MLFVMVDFKFAALLRQALRQSQLIFPCFNNPSIHLKIEIIQLDG